MATVVFADLVGSTGIFERLGDETAGRFVTQLTTALSKTFQQYNGRVVKLLGDGCTWFFRAKHSGAAILYWPTPPASVPGFIWDQTAPVVLRRTECYRVDQGQISLGCEREAES